MKKKLLLLYPGSLFAENRKFCWYLKPYMIYVYTFLSKFFDTKVIDLEIEFFNLLHNQTKHEKFKELSLKMILSEDFEYLAISCWSSFDYLSSIFIAENIKKIKPNTKIIVGGYHPTFVPEDFKYKNTPFDYIIKGDIQNILKILNLDYNNNDNKIFPPDFLSYPYFSKKTNEDIGIFLSQGCPFQCSYCGEKINKWIPIEVKKAIKQICELNENISPSHILILDPCFGFNKKWRRKFLAELINKEIDTKFWVETRVDIINEEDIKLISKLDIKISFGIESFSQTMLKIMNKTKNPAFFLKKFVELSKLCSDYNIVHDATLILNHPGDSEKILKEYNYFYENKLMRVLNGGYLRLIATNFFFYPGCDIYKNYSYYNKKFGTKVLHPEWWKENDNHHILGRLIIPSTKEKGKPYISPLKDIYEQIREFNIDNSKGVEEEKKFWNKKS